MALVRHRTRLRALATLPQVALGDKPADGPHVVQLEQGGSKFTLCTLRKGVCDQFNVRTIPIQQWSDLI